MTDYVRNDKSLLAQLKETDNPELLTVNGCPEYVILDANSYQSISNELERIRFIRAVNEALRTCGRVGPTP